MHRIKLSISLLLIALLSVNAQRPKKPNSSEILESIQKLNVLASVLYVAAHPDDENDTAYIIYNNFQKDRHYAKLGPRMGNLTEAHLHSLGAKNIMHTAWRSEESLQRNIKKALQRHTRVVIVLSGYLVPSLTIADNTALQTLTDANMTVNLDENVEIEEYFRVTDANIDAYADCVFSDLSGDHVLVKAEQVIYTYYKNKLHLNYIDL